MKSLILVSALAAIIIPNGVASQTTKAPVDCSTGKLDPECYGLKKVRTDVVDESATTQCSEAFENVGITAFNVVGYLSYNSSCVAECVGRVVVQYLGKKTR